MCVFSAFSKRVYVENIYLKYKHKFAIDKMRVLSLETVSYLP